MRVTNTISIPELAPERSATICPDPRLSICRCGAEAVCVCAHLFILALSLALLVGCGASDLYSYRSSGSNGGSSSGTSGGGSGSGGGGSSSASGAVLVTLGDFASVPDNIVSLELTIDSVSLRPGSTGDISLLSNPRRVELSRLKAEPLLLNNAPVGFYQGVVIGVSNPEISYIDSSGALHEKIAASLTSTTATNASQFSIGSTPGEINLNPFFGDSPLGGVVTLNPRLNFSTGDIPFKNLVGRISSVSNNSLTMDAGNGSFTFATDSNTKFKNINALNELTSGMTVEVDAALSAGGAIRATRVKLEQQFDGELVAEGLISTLVPSQLQILVREVHGPTGVALPELGKALTVNANDSAAEFHLEPDGVDLANLDFTPAFDALAIAPGQNVRAAATSGGSATTITAEQINLEEQSLVGTADTVSAGSVSGQFNFPLKLDPDSAFARLTGHTSVYVTLQPAAQKFLYFGSEDCVTCIANGTVRARGLLFFSSGQYRLVADWLSVE